MIESRKENIISLINSGQLKQAATMLNENLMDDIKDTESYELLVEVYKKLDDYHSLIKVLNKAIKHSSQKQWFKDIKKCFVLEEISKDLHDLD